MKRLCLCPSSLGGLLPGDGDRPNFYPSEGSAPNCIQCSVASISGISDSDQIYTDSDCLFRSPSIHQSSDLAHVWKRNLFESSVAQCDKLCISMYGVCLDMALWPSLKWSYRESKQCTPSVAKFPELRVPSGLQWKMKSMWSAPRSCGWTGALKGREYSAWYRWQLWQQFLGTP